jgi:hypothetical protein
MVADLGIVQIRSDCVIGAYETTKTGHPLLLLRMWQPIIWSESTCRRQEQLPRDVEEINSALGASAIYACELTGTRNLS